MEPKSRSVTPPHPSRISRKSGNLKREKSSVSGLETVLRYNFSNIRFRSDLQNLKHWFRSRFETLKPKKMCAPLEHMKMFVSKVNEESLYFIFEWQSTKLESKFFLMQITEQLH